MLQALLIEVYAMFVHCPAGKLSLILKTPRRDPPSNLHVENLSHCQHGVVDLNMQYFQYKTERSEERVS